jgi:ribosomal protein S18 acetylase RimI-like enzyme
MTFSITDTLFNEIISALDNQEIKYLVDSQTGTLIEADKAGKDEDRFYELPEWNSASGFKLREDFVETVRIPLVKEKLQTVMHSGRGVFKNFRLVLKEYPEVEKRWFIFKNNTMGLYINQWYNDLREIWGLEKLDYIPESDENLIHDDFVFSEYESAVNREDVILHMHEFFLGKEQDLSEELREAFFEMWKKQFMNADSTGQTGLICHSLSDDFAGCITASSLIENQEKISVLTNLFVPENYRGLGIGTELISMCFAKLKENGTRWVLLPDVIMSETLQPLLSRMGFEKAGYGYAAKLQ